MCCCRLAARSALQCTSAQCPMPDPISCQIQCAAAQCRRCCGSLLLTVARVVPACCSCHSTDSIDRTAAQVCNHGTFLFALASEIATDHEEQLLLFPTFHWKAPFIMPHEVAPSDVAPIVLAPMSASSADTNGPCARAMCALWAQTWRHTGRTLGTGEGHPERSNPPLSPGERYVPSCAGRGCTTQAHWKQTLCRPCVNLL